MSEKFSRKSFEKNLTFKKFRKGFEKSETDSISFIISNEDFLKFFLTALKWRRSGRRHGWWERSNWTCLCNRRQICSQLIYVRHQSLVLSSQFQQEFFLSLNLIAVRDCRTQNVHLCNSIMRLQSWNRTLQLNEEILHVNATLSLHGVMHASLLDWCSFRIVIA